MKTLSLLLGLLTALNVCWGRPAADNLLANPGFQEGEGTPDSWAFNPRRTNSQISWDAERGRPERPCVRITNPTRADTGNVVQSLTFDPPIPQGSRVSFAARASAESGGVPTIIIQMYSPSDIRQNATASHGAAQDSFTLVEGQALTTRPVDRLSVYLCNYATGTVWWDDATLSIERAEPTKVVPRAPGARSLPGLQTNGGLSLVLSDNGSVKSLSLDGRDLTVRESLSGLWVRVFGQDMKPVTGDLTAQAGAVTQAYRDDASGIRVTAAFTAKDEVITCDGAIEGLTDRDIGLDLVLALPVGHAGWTWGRSIREEVPLSGDPEAVDATTFSSVSQPETGDGIALAVPADSPCDVEFAHDAEFGYTARMRLGLSPAAAGELKNRAPFHFVIYRCDGAWGLRDAARRYYRLYPAAFEKRVRREGLWMFSSPRFELPDPENYAFHEGGPSGWEYDDAHDIATCPYIIPGQREITRLDTLPTSRAEALEVLREFQPTQDRRGRGWGSNVKAIIESCMLSDAKGEPHVRIRNTPWGGNSVTFPLNASPYLYDSDDRITIAKTLLSHVAAMHDETPGLDGTYVDSLGAWGSYLNYRREHFGHTRVPLTYGAANGRPVLHNRFSLLEFLWALRDDLHERGKLLFANGVHQDRRFHFFALDIMGVEGRSWLEQKRVMACQKPFLLLIYNIHDDPAQMEYWFNRCMLYGIYPSFGSMRVYETPEMYAPVAALNRRYVPAMQTITAAGWQPVTHARCDGAQVWVERWGPGDDGAVYLTVYNSADTDRDAELRISLGELGLTGPRIAIDDLLSEDGWEARVEDGEARVVVPIPAERVRVLRLAEAE